VGIVPRPSRSRSDATDERTDTSLRDEADHPVLCGDAECALWDGKRLVFTVEEAARRLHIGRTLAYQQTQLYLTTGGRDGIPAVKIGGAVRIPVPGLWILAFSGRVVTPAELEELANNSLARSYELPGASAPACHDHASDDTSARRGRRSPSRRRAGSAEQLVLVPGA
jgi:hypothetical protein